MANIGHSFEPILGQSLGKDWFNAKEEWNL
jgi:hypothetical protein